MQICDFQIRLQELGIRKSELFLSCCLFKVFTKMNHMYKKHLRTLDRKTKLGSLKDKHMHEDELIFTQFSEVQMVGATILELMF